MFELIPYTRINSLSRLHRDMNDLWQRFFDGESPLAAAGQTEFLPSVNVVENDEAIEVTAEVPGMKPEDIKISLTGDVLTIKGEKTEQREEAQGNYHLIERQFGSFKRSFRLPAEVDHEKLKAKSKDGVLTIVLPKVQKAGSTTIEVKSEE